MKEKTKKIIKKIAIGVVVIGGIGAVVGYAIYNKVKNTEGSDLWYGNESLENIKAYREKLGIKFFNAGLNNMSDAEYNKLERDLLKADNVINFIENAIYEQEHPNAQTVSHSNGWYLTSDD